MVLSSLDTIARRFKISVPEGASYQANYNVSPGSIAPTLTQQEPKRLQFFQFGLRPYWAKKPMYLFNARAEGNYNQENDPKYQGKLGIVDKPSFRRPVRSQRCLIIADCFVEGSTQEKLNKPYLVYLRNKRRPFAFAGIWDSWTDQESGEILNSFAIITTVSNRLLQMIPHHRSPVILKPEEESLWLSDRPLEDILGLLKPYPAELMNAYPIDKAIKNPQAQGKGLVQAIGEPLLPENPA